MLGPQQLRHGCMYQIDRCLVLNHSATVACIRSDTCNRGGVVKNQASTTKSWVRLSTWILRFHHNQYCSCGHLIYESRVHIAAFSSCVPTVVMGYHVWRLSSWSDVVLPCWLTVRHPFRSETEMPTSGRVPRILFLLLGQTMILLCRLHTQSARTQDCD